MEDIETLSVLYVCWLTLMSLILLPWMFTGELRGSTSSALPVAGVALANLLSVVSALILVDAGGGSWTSISLEAQDLVLEMTAIAIATSWIAWIGQRARARWVRLVAHLPLSILRGGDLLRGSGRYSTR
jgi:hypothetical protein